MATPFLSSEEYDERAHQLYNDGQYDDALTVLREGLALYPNSVELHVGVGYAQLAREEYAWARQSFEQAACSSRSTKTRSPDSVRLYSSSARMNRRCDASAGPSSLAMRMISI